MNFNVEFTIEMFKEDRPLTYFYFRVRRFAMDNGGYFHKMELTKKERYEKVKKLRNLGLVDKDKFRVIKHRTVVKDCQTQLNANIHDDYLQSFLNFKGFMLALAEVYILDRNYLRQEGRARVFDSRNNEWSCKRTHMGVNHYLNGDNKIYSITKFNGNNNRYYRGVIANSTLCKVLNISDRSVSKWRHHSCNEYKVKIRELPRYAEFSEKGSKGYYSKSKGKLVLPYCEIKSGLIISYNKFTRKAYIKELQTI